MRISDETLRIGAWAGWYGMGVGAAGAAAGAFMLGADVITKLTHDGKSPEGIDEMAGLVIAGGLGVWIASFLLCAATVYAGHKRGLV